MDLLYIGLIVAFVAASVALVYGFESSRGGHELDLHPERHDRRRQSSCISSSRCSGGEILMTTNGTLQIVLYMVVLIALAKTARRLHGGHLRRQTGHPEPVRRADRAPHLSALRREGVGGDELDPVRSGDAMVQPRRTADRLWTAAAAASPAVQSRRHGGGVAGFLLQHGDQLSSPTPTGRATAASPP